MKQLPFPSLLDAIATGKGNSEEFCRMPDVVRMFQGRDVPVDYVEHPEQVQRGQLDEIFDIVVNDRKEYDDYHIYGEMVNQFIQAFPEMKDAWSKISTDQKWIFVEGLYYGCHSPVRNHLGYKQVG